MTDSAGTSRFGFKARVRRFAKHAAILFTCMAVADLIAVLAFTPAREPRHLLLVVDITVAVVSGVGLLSVIGASGTRMSTLAENMRLGRATTTEEVRASFEKEDAALGFMTLCVATALCYLAAGHALVSALFPNAPG